MTITNKDSLLLLLFQFPLQSISRLLCTKKTEVQAPRTSENIDLRRLMGECKIKCSLATCAKDIDVLDRESMIQYSEDQCTYHLLCASDILKKKDRRIVL